MKLGKVLSDKLVNFVCSRCQKIYYQEDMHVFNSDPRKVTRDAKVYKGHYHSCKAKRSKKKYHSRPGRYSK